MLYDGLDFSIASIYWLWKLHHRMTCFIFTDMLLWQKRYFYVVWAKTSSMIFFLICNRFFLGNRFLSFHQYFFTFRVVHLKLCFVVEIKQLALWYCSIYSFFLILSFFNKMIKKRVFEMYILEINFIVLKDRMKSLYFKWNYFIRRNATGTTFGKFITCTRQL